MALLCSTTGRLIQSPKWCGTMNSHVAAAVWCGCCTAWHKTLCKFRSATKYLTLVTDGRLQGWRSAAHGAWRIHKVHNCVSLVPVKFSGCAMCSDRMRSISPWKMLVAGWAQTPELHCVREPGGTLSSASSSFLSAAGCVQKMLITHTYVFRRLGFLYSV